MPTQLDLVSTTPEPTKDYKSRHPNAHIDQAEAKDDKLICMYTNADSIGNKINELHAYIDTYHPNIICLTETLPKYRPLNSEPPTITIPGYTGYHATLGRGITVLIDSDLKAEELSMTSIFLESTWLKISLKNNRILLLGCLYRSPNSNEENNNHLLDLLEEASRREKDHLVIVGDFNMKEIDWAEHKVNTRESHLSYRTFDKVNDLFLEQLVTEPTRHREGEQANVLDWVLTDSSDNISNLSIKAPLGVRGDHNVIQFEFLTPPIIQNRPRRFNLYKGNYETMEANLASYNWSTLLSDKDCQQSWNTFRDTISLAMENHIPKSRHGKTKNKKLWMNKDTRLLIKTKNRAWNRYKSNKTDVNWSAFAKIRNETNRAVTQVKKNFEQKIAREIKSNPKQFWRYVNSKNPRVREFPTMYDQDGVEYACDNEKASLFNLYFANVFTKEDSSTVLSLPHPVTNTSLEYIEITPQIVLKYIQKLNTAKAAGPDEMYPKILYEVKEAICEPLSIIFNKSLEEGRLPSDWKQAVVKPIYKKGTKSAPSNYRPVSLTSVCCKIMERMLRDKIFDYFENNDLFSKDQHGFRQGKSCTTQLLEILELWSKFIDEGKAFDCIYLDFSKAFDKVPHFRLAYKVKHYGIKGNLLKWINSFLENRMQSVAINNCKSDPLPVTSGIPQGSVLGPLLFVIYINDLPNVVKSHIKIFADDTKIFRAISDNNDSSSLQSDLTSLLEWSYDWLLPFNTEKCAIIHYGPNNPEYVYKMRDNNIKESKYERDLGITFDNKLNFTTHVRNIVSKANSRVGLLRRNFSNMSPEMFLPLYKSLIRPLLEYGSSVWNPSLISNIKETEKVQRRATKLVSNIKHLPYNERLRKLKLDSLAFRRRRTDILQVYRIINKIDKLKMEDFFEFHNGPNTRGHSLKLNKPRALTSFRSHAFSNRIINDWNGLKNETVTKTSLNTFKTALINEWADHPDRYAESYPLDT